MDKLLDKLESLIESTGTRSRHIMASGELEGKAGLDGHGNREGGKFAPPKAAGYPAPKPVQSAGPALTKTTSVKPGAGQKSSY